MEFRRVLFRSSAGEGGRIERASDGTVGVSPVKDDLSGVARFTGETASGSLGTGGSETYAFTIRDSEMAGPQGGLVILRVATTCDATPAIAGLTPIASAMPAGQRVTLFALRDPGLCALTVEPKRVTSRQIAPACLYLAG